MQKLSCSCGAHNEDLVLSGKLAVLYVTEKVEFCSGQVFKNKANHHELNSITINYIIYATT